MKRSDVTTLLYSSFIFNSTQTKLELNKQERKYKILTKKPKTSYLHFFNLVLLLREPNSNRKYIQNTNRTPWTPQHCWSLFNELSKSWSTAFSVGKKFHLLIPWSRNKLCLDIWKHTSLFPTNAPHVSLLTQSTLDSCLHTQIFITELKTKFWQWVYKEKYITHYNNSSFAPWMPCSFPYLFHCAMSEPLAPPSGQKGPPMEMIL